MQENQGSSLSRNLIFTIIKGAVSFGIIWLILKKISIVSIYQTLKTLPPWALAISIAFTILSRLFSSLRWRLYITSSPPATTLFSFYLIATFFNTVLPGIIGGDGVRIYYLYKRIRNLPESLASVFFERYLGYSILMAFGLLGYPFTFAAMRGTLLAWIFPFIILVYLAASIAIFKTRIGSLWKGTSPFFHILQEYLAGRVSIIKGLLYSILVQGFVILSVWVLSVGLGHGLPVIAFFALVPLIVVISTLPISISGLGVREFSFIILFGSLGLPAEDATILSLTWFLSLTLAGLAGLSEYLRVRRVPMTAPMSDDSHPWLAH